MFCPIEQDKRWIKLLSFLKDRDKAIYYWNVYEENVPDYFYDSLPIQDTSNTEVQSDPLSISIKPGVQELFDSNPELANAVYSALGFEQGNSNYYEGDIKPEPNTIFVFGSNPEGRHGAGAAKVAKTQFGAIYGQGEGLQGNAYALPTKDLRVKENKGFKSISPKQITKSIEKLYEVAKQNPDKQFKVGYRNTTEISLNGYTGLEMIEMFNQAGAIPSNVIFSKEWVDTGKLSIPSQITPQQKQEAQQQYSQYLDTIFPDSKVKDIVYRGGNLGTKQPQDVEAFTTNKSYAEYRAEQNNTQVYPAILNIQESKLLDKKETRTISLDRDEFEYQDYGFTDNKDQTRQLGNFYTVKENNRHILGSKQDIEGFKKFVQGKPKSVKPGVEELFESNPELPKKLENTLFGLDNNSLEFHINTLGVISNFLENIGVEQRLIPEFLAQDGSVVEGALAAANFIQGTVDIIDDLNKRPDAWNKLPEEAAHWWYRLLKDSSPLKKALWESHTTALKNDELYKTNYGKNVKLPSDLTEESIGQLIAEAIKRIETKNANASDYSFFKMFLEWLNSVIDIFRTTNQDPFEVAAMKILSSDMSDLMTWEEYRKLNNIVNFADVLTEQSVAPIDYTLIEDIGSKESRFQDLGDEIIIGWVFMFNDSQKESPVFENHEDLDSWVSANIPEHNERQYALIQEVKDNQQFFDRLLNKTFRKRSKYLAKTLRKYFNIIDAQNLNSLKEWNISKELQQVTKKLTEQEKKQIIETNGYTNIAPTLKVLPDLLQKYGRKTNPEIIKQEIEITNKLIKKEITKEEAVELRQKLENKKKGNPIVLSEPIKIDGAKKQELAILNGIKEMIKLENPSLKSITAEEFVAEAHNWLETNYLLGFANEQVYLSYRTDQTFTYLNDRNTIQDVRNLTDEELQNLPFEERQRLANTLGLTKQNPDVYHNKVSIRFNDMSHLKSGHFNLPGGGSPSAWGNLTYFYSGKNKWKDAVLLHEIQNDNIEFLRDYKAEKVDLETSLGRYLQQLNTDLIDNITQIETGGKTIQRNNLESSPKQYIQLDYLLQQLVEQPLEQGLNNLKQNLNEKIELYKSDDSVRNSPEKAKEHVDKLFSQRRKFVDFQKRGGIKSLLSKEDLESLKEIIKELNTGTVMTDPVFSPDENQYEPGYETFRNLKQKKQDFKFKSGKILSKINNKFKELYGEDVPIITLNAPAKPLPKAQRRGRIVNAGTTREIIIGNASQDLNESVNYLIAFSEQQIIKKFSKDIEESKENYIRARNAYNSFNFNLNLVKITQEQYNNLIENYKYNQDLLNRLIDEQAQKDIKSPQLEKIAKAKSIIKYLGDDSSIKLGTGKYGFIWDTADTDKGIVSVWDAYKAGNTDEDSYIDNWSVDEFLEYVKKVAPEYLTLDTKSIDIKNQEFKFNELKQKALDKKEELEKNYGKLEEEIKQTLEIEMNYFTPLVHHLIQKHINQYGKDFPMYFSGYNITKLTQGNDRTALIYAGKDEINIVDKKQFKINSDIYATDEGSYNKTNPLESFNYFKNNNVISQQEYQKAYQQATERKAKEIKFQAAQQIGIIPLISNGEKISLEEGIKKLNEYKKQSKQNLDRVVNTIMNISGSEPIETGAIYNAMTQISGIKLIWQDKVDGLKNNAGGYLIDLSGYNYNTPILYGLTNKQDTEGFKEFINNQTINNESTSDSVLTDEQIQESTEFLNQIGSDFKLEKLDTNEKVLEYVIDNSNDESLKAVTKHLLKHLNKIDFIKFKGVVTLESKTIAGMYRKTTGDIYLNNNSTSRWTKEEYLQTIIHEYIHAFTINALENPQTQEEKEFEKKIYNIFLELRKDSYFEDEYGFTNTKEFVSELLTNPDFRDKALHVRKNILDNIIDLIKELLGIKIKAKYSTKNEKLLETGFKTTLNFIPNSSPRLANFDKENDRVYYNDKVSSKNNPYYKQNIINRINSFNTLEELNQAWNSPKFTEEQKIEFKEYFTKRKEIILAHMKRAEDFRNYVKTNTGVFKTIKLGEKYNEFEAQITGNIVNGQIEVRTNTDKILLVTMSQLRDKNQDNNKDLSRINHRLSKFEFSDELRLLYNQLSEKYDYDMDKVHKDIILRPNVSFQPFFVNEENELVGVYYYSSEINPTFTRFAKSIQDSRASFLRDAMTNNFKLNIIQKYSPLAKYYPSKLVSFYYSLPENELKNLDKFLKKEGYEKIEDLFNNKIAIISEDDIIELLKCHI